MEEQLELIFDEFIKDIENKNIEKVKDKKNKLIKLYLDNFNRNQKLVEKIIMVCFEVGDD